MRILDRYELFIFDWDHTLTTSTLLVTLLGGLRKVRGRRKQNAIKMQKEDYKPSDDIRKIKMISESNKLYSVMDDAYSAIFRPKLKTDVVPLLELLKKKHKKIAIFSDAKMHRLLNEMKSLGVVKYIDFALSAEAIDYYKPNPTGLLLVADRFRVPKRKSIYVGDMATDAITARFAGIDSCIVSSNIDTPERLREVKPSYLFKTLAELTRTMKY